MDKNTDNRGPDIRKVLTFKSGNFVFSRRYDRQKIETELRVFHARHAIIASLPLLPNWASFLDEELIRKSIFSTAAIEGNPLDEAAVDNILLRDGEPVSPEDFEREIINLKTAHARFLGSARRQEPLPLTEDLIRAVHGGITAGIREGENSPGNYRNQLVKVGNPEHGGTYVPPKILEDVKTLMQTFIDWINSPELLQEDPIIRAALAHYHLGKIHPFRDGNGRTARMIEAMILAAAGMKYIPNALWNYYYKHLHEYFIAFPTTEKDKEHGVQPFLDFYIPAINTALDDILSRIVNLLKPILLQNYISFLRDKGKSISQRQYEFSIMLLDKPMPLNARQIKTTSPFGILYKTVSEKTVKRDIERLFQLGVLVKDGEKYRLNFDLVPPSESPPAS